MLEGLEDELHRDEADGDPREGCEAPGLTGVEEVADEEADRRAGEDPPDDERRVEAADRHRQVEDEEELDQVVDREAEEPVQIPPDEPPCGGALSRHPITGSRSAPSSAHGRGSSSRRPSPR